MQVCFLFIVVERGKALHTVLFLKFIYHLFQQIVMVITDKTFRQGDHQFPRLDTLSICSAFFKFFLITLGKFPPECPVRLCCIDFIQMLLLGVAGNISDAPRLLGRMENTVRLFRTVNPRLRGFAPCKGEIPGVQNEVLCVGCISLSNAEGLGKGLRPSRKLPADTP